MKKRSLTLLEIMIVILLIGLIGSVIGYNMKGSLEEGRAFKTEQGASQIRDILLLEVAKGAPLSEVTADPEIYLKRSGLVKNAKKILSDGWGEPYTITANEKGGITVHSEKLVAFQEKKGRTPSNEDDED